MENYPKIAIEKGTIDEVITMMIRGQNNERLIRKRFEIDDVTEKFSVAHFGDCNRNDDIY